MRKINVGTIGAMSLAMAQAQKVVDEKEPQPIEPPELDRGIGVVTSNKYKNYAHLEMNEYTNNPNYHPKRTRKSKPLHIGSYKQKRK